MSNDRTEPSFCGQVPSTHCSMSYTSLASQPDFIALERRENASRSHWRPDGQCTSWTSRPEEMWAQTGES